MPDAIVDAVYFDSVVDEHCICSAITDSEDGPRVTLQYLDSGAMVTVPVEPFRQTASIEVRQLPGEPDADSNVEAVE